MTELSIIIPVYNREKTIEKCLGSLLESLGAQPDFNAEIILVDDGSADNSVELCKKYAAEHNFISLIENRHGGVSAARNAGISASVGDYIAFIDSDDYVGADYAAQIRSAIKTKPELAIFNAHYILNPNGDYAKASAELAEGAGLDVREIYAPLLTQCLNACWDKLYRASIIRDNLISFNENMQISEDYAFVLSYVSKCSSASVFPIIDYYYRFAIEGYRKIYPNHVSDLLSAYLQTADFINEKGIDIPKDVLCKRFLQLLCEFLIKIYKSGYFDAELKSAVENSLLYKDINSADFKKPKSRIEKYIVTHGAYRFGALFLKAVRTVERLLNRAR